MKKIFAAGMSLFLSAAMLFASAACHIDTGRDSVGGDSLRPGADSEEPPVVNPDATVTITLGTLADKEETGLMNRWANAFMKKHSEVKIERTKTMEGMPSVILWESTNELPDIIWTAGDQHSPYSSAGYFQDLSDESKFPGSAEFFSGFYDALIETTHHSLNDEKIWFVPRDYNRLVVYLNKTAFAEADIALPDNDWTWDEFVEICNKFMNLETKRRPKKAVEWKKWRPIYATMLKNFGGEYLDAEGNLTIDSAGTRACFDFYKTLYKTSKGEGDPATAAIALASEGTGFKGYTGLKNSIPMIVDVRPQLPSYVQAANAGNDDEKWEVGVRAFPNFVQSDGSAGYVGAGCSGYGISKACTDPDKLHWAWEFLKFCISEEGYEAVASIGNIVPALTSMRDSGAWREYQYLDNEDDVNAYVATNTNDMFLNYAAALPAKKQDTFIGFVDDFWKNVDTMTYAGAIERIKGDFDDKIAK